MKTHLTDIRLANNAGMRIPVCIRNAELLNTEASGWPQTKELKEVTCWRCRKSAPKLYQWAYAKAS